MSNIHLSGIGAGLGASPQSESASQSILSGQDFSEILINKISKAQSSSVSLKGSAGDIEKINTAVNGLIKGEAVDLKVLFGTELSTSPRVNPQPTDSVR